jgi:hypothetical protein
MVEGWVFGGCYALANILKAVIPYGGKGMIGSVLCAQAPRDVGGCMWDAM